jgi:hypothetical protein
MSLLLLFNTFLALVAFDSDKLRVAHVIIYIAAFLLILITSSRVALFSLIFLIAGHIYIKKAKKVKIGFMGRFAWVMLIISVLFAYAYSFILPRIFTADIQILGKKLFSGRNILWYDCFKAIFSNVQGLFGNGYNQFTELFNESANSIYTDMHNQALRIMYTYGLIFFAVYVIITKRAYQLQAKYNSSHNTPFLFVMYIVAAIICIFETAITNAMFTFFISLFYISSYETGNKKNTGAGILNCDINLKEKN